MKMKNLIFCVAMNFISAIVLIGAGAMEMNNLLLLGYVGLLELRRINKKWMEYILHPLFMRGSTHEVDRYSQYQLPPGRAQSTFLLLHQRCGCGKVLLRYFLTEKVTKR